jgi:hypothetical protein
MTQARLMMSPQGSDHVRLLLFSIVTVLQRLVDASAALLTGE